VRFSGVVFRAHHPRWSFLPKSGEGAARHGGRFNPKGTPALYTSLRQETAWLEAQQGFAFKAQPMTIISYHVDCEDIIDLTDRLECERLSVAPADLACPWEDMASKGDDPPSWILARRQIAMKTAGIKVQSFALGASSTDVNIVLWRWSDEWPHQIRVVDDHDRLPKDDASWR
jgi:RES domain-containing protein